MFIAMLCASTFAFAYDFEVDGIYYDIDASAGTAIVAKGDIPYSGNIFVPDVITIKDRELQVISLGGAFNGSLISSISIGKNISEIEFEDFEGCNELKEMTFEPSDKPIHLISKYVYNDYYANVGLFYKIPLEKISFGRDVVLKYREDGGYARNDNHSPFVYSNYWGIQGHCTTLKEISFSKECSSIPAGICCNSTLGTLVIGESVKEIGENAFQNCLLLDKIIINNIDAFASVQFGDSPQRGRTLYDEYGNAITNLIIHAQLISSNAFSGVNDIESVTLDDNVISVESNAFNGMQSLKTVKIMGDKVTWGTGIFSDNSQLEEIEINQLSSIGARMFENCPAIKVLSCPNVKNIDEYAFYGCTNLENINAPILSSIGAYSFAKTKLNTITFPLITKIDNNAFSNCNNLLNADFGVKIDTFGENIFEECKNLSSLTIKSLNPPSCNNSFTNFTYVNTTLSVPELSVEEYKSESPWSNFFDITSIQLNYFELGGCLYYIDGNTGVLISVVNKDIETLNIPQSIIYNNESVIIGDYLENCFNGLTSLKNLTLPSSFYDLPVINTLSSLEAVSINSEYIPENYFMNLANIEKINLGNNIITIGKNAFKNCKNLKSIQVPATCVEIGTDAFEGCSKLSNVIFDASSQKITLSYNSKLNLSSSITPFPNPSNVEERRTGFKNGYYDGLFYGLSIEHLVINRDIELPKYYERTVGSSTSSYAIVYNDIIYYPPFYGMTNLKTVEIGENVSAICKNQIEAVINATHATMEYANFGKCDNIEVVVSNNPNAPIGGGFSQIVYENASLFLPNGGSDSYKNDGYWKKFLHMTESSFIAIESISFESDDVTIDTNDSKFLHPIINPSDASIKTLKWSSSKPSIANVSEDGMITTSSREGEAIITASTCDGTHVSASIKIIVQEGAGISDVSADDRFDISVENGRLYIRGKHDTDTVSIYNVQGQLIISTYDNEIELSTKGIYIIKVGSTCKKIML